MGGPSAKYKDGRSTTEFRHDTTPLWRGEICSSLPHRAACRIQSRMWEPQWHTHVVPSSSKCYAQHNLWMVPHPCLCAEGSDLSNPSLDKHGRVVDATLLEIVPIWGAREWQLLEKTVINRGVICFLRMMHIPLGKRIGNTLVTESLFIIAILLFATRGLCDCEYIEHAAIHIHRTIRSLRTKLLIAKRCM